MKPIGELIKERLKAEERSVAWFARKLSCSRVNVYKIFCKEYRDSLGEEYKVPLCNLYK